MPLFPNPRVNKRERDEILFGSLGGKTIDTSALAEKMPSSAELSKYRGLFDTPAEAEEAFLGDYAGAIYKPGTAAAMADADVAAKSKAQADFTAKGGLSPSGKVYRSPTGNMPLGDDVEQLLADARQPANPSGPYASSRNAGRWENLRATMPAKNDSVPLKPHEVTPAMMQEGRRNNPELFPSHRLGLPPEALKAAASSEAKRIHAAGEANIAAGEAARPQVAHNAQVAAVSRRYGMNPLQASLFVGSGLGGPSASQANDAVASGGLPMNPHLMTLLGPDVIKEQMRTQAYGEAARQRNAVDMRTADANERTQKIQAIGALSQIDDADFERRIALATNDQDRQRLQDEKLANRRKRQNQIAQLADVDVSAPEPSYAGDSRGPFAGLNPSRQVDASQPGGPPSAATSPAGVFPLPRDNSPEAQRQSLAEFQPNFADLWAGAPFGEPELSALHSGQYRPGMGSFADANANGKWDQGERFTNDAAAKYYMGADAARKIVDEITGAMDSMGPLTSWGDKYKRLNEMFGTRYGQDAIRWAMAKKAGMTGWIKDYDLFKSEVINPPQSVFSYWRGR